MKLKAVSAMILILLFIGMLTLAFNVQQIKASGTIYISSDYTFTSNIYEPIVVTADNIIIDGAGYTVQGTGASGSKGIDLSGRNHVALKNVEVTNFSFGIWLQDSSNNVLSGNNVYSNNAYGIFLYESSNSNVLTSNTVLNNSDGIRLDSSSNNLLTDNTASNNTLGINLRYSSNNVLTGNTASNNNHGILLDQSSNNNVLTDNTASNNSRGIDVNYSSNNLLSGNTASNKAVGITLYESTNNVLAGNTLSSHRTGILLQDSSNNFLSGNNVYSNNYNGIRLGWSSNNVLTGNTVLNNSNGIFLQDSSNNIFFHNNLINNTHQVYDLSWGNPTVPSSVNTWDNGYPSGGNYWSDYTDVDQYSGPNQDQLGSDGIWDHPYVIDANNRDRYPLISVWVDVEPPNADAGPDQSVFKGMTVTFDGSTSTDNVGIASYTWSFVDITLKTMTGMQPKYTFNNVGDFEVTLNVSDYAGYWDTGTMWVHVLSDTTKPSIGTVSQEPQVPDEGEKVTITINVTDGESGVHNVTISYRTNSGPWTNVSMSKLTGDTWEGEILGLPAETNVQYKIIAYDKAGNFEVDDQLGPYYVYTVIPEFPTWTPMLLILILLAIAIAIYKRRLLKTPTH